MHRLRAWFALFLMGVPLSAEGKPVIYYAFGRSAHNYIVYAVYAPNSSWVIPMAYFDDMGKIQTCTAIEYRANGVTVYTTIANAKAWLKSL